MESKHGGVQSHQTFGDLLEVKILKTYRNPFTRNGKEGMYIANHGKVLNSKSEWHQQQIVRTKTTIIQGGADQFLGAGEGLPDRR